MHLAIDMYKKYSKKKKINDYFFLLINQNIIYDHCAYKKITAVTKGTVKPKGKILLIFFFSEASWQYSFLGGAI
jgi:hypothetical protein